MMFMQEKWIREGVRRMHGYVPGEQPAQTDLIKLNTNENPYPPAPGVMEMLQKITADALRRYPPPTSAKLRKCVADVYGFGEKSVFCGNGSDEILALCTRAFVERGRKIGYFDPSYSLYPVLASIEESNTVEVVLGERFGWVDPPLDADIALFFLTNPNAPTGMRFPLEKIEAFCKAFDGIVLMDEAYVDFATADCLSLARNLPNVIVSRSLSKSYSLAGLRVGYALGHPALIEALDKIKDSYNLDIVAQQLAAAALTDQAYMRSCTQRIRATRDRFSQALEARGFEVYPSETNFVWCQPPAGLRAPEYVEALRARNILIRYFPAERLAPFVRITIGLEEQMERLMEETDKILEEYHG
jgi:histidinol-phosphate aminotransferase